MGACQLTPEVQAKLVARVGGGSKLVDAARAEGITAGTVRNWMHWGQEGREPYKAFSEAIQVAEALPKADALEAWRAACLTDWRAAKAFVEYVDKRQATVASVELQLEEFLLTVERELGEDAAKKVLRAYIERTGSAETGDARAALRLVAT